MPANENVVQIAKLFFESYMDLYNAVEMISLSTTDGFPVYSACKHGIKFDVDTMAAASSTLYSVSNAVSKQILSKHFKITFIESEQGNIGFVSLTLENQDYVLSMSANRGMNIGQLRALINRLAEELVAELKP